MAHHEMTTDEYMRKWNIPPQFKLISQTLRTAKQGHFVERELWKKRGKKEENE
jgi:predicted transcriptional regulator